MRRIVQASTRPGDWCLDFFAGSRNARRGGGSLGRRYVLIDCSRRGDPCLPRAPGGGVWRRPVATGPATAASGCVRRRRLSGETMYGLARPAARQQVLDRLDGLLDALEHPPPLARAAGHRRRRRRPARSADRDGSRAARGRPTRRPRQRRPRSRRAPRRREPGCRRRRAARSAVRSVSRIVW